jgi:hypothetical protein
LAVGGFGVQGEDGEDFVDFVHGGPFLGASRVVVGKHYCLGPKEGRFRRSGFM